METERNVLMILANHDFNEEEYLITRKVLEDNGIVVKVAALDFGVCYGKNNMEVETDISLTDVNAEGFDAIVFVGGAGVEMYFDQESILNLANDFNSSDKLVCAICWAPVILAKAGLLAHKQATVWNGAVKDLEMVDATYTGEAVTVDGNIVTANGPLASEQFGEQIASMLSTTI